jgi:hypothetical protein
VPGRSTGKPEKTPLFLGPERPEPIEVHAGTQPERENRVPYAPVAVDPSSGWGKEVQFPGSLFRNMQNEGVRRNAEVGSRTVQRRGFFLLHGQLDVQQIHGPGPYG